ncbi:hypothetical protein V8Z80_08305 [Orrella sp. JC864]|uniref:hypothetical protein n=1 Tax=Orrella sp. JC864 TaxID=3120298 RepID=UPI003008EA03
MSNPHRKARRAKARNKPYRPKPSEPPMLVGSHLVLSPLEHMVEQLERDGTLDTDERGTPIVIGRDGREYDAAGALEGVLWHFEMMSIRHGVTLPLDGLRELMIACRYLVPVQSGTIAKLRADLPVLRRAMATGSRVDQIDLLQQCRIKAALENIVTPDGGRCPPGSRP